MKGKKHSPEQIVKKLREADAMIAGGKTVGQVALRWLVQQENVAAIPKAASEKHMRENFNIFDFTLDETDMKIIHGLAREGGRLINPDWAPKWDAHRAA